VPILCCCSLCDCSIDSPLMDCKRTCPPLHVWIFLQVLQAIITLGAVFVPWDVRWMGHLEVVFLATMDTDIWEILGAVSLCREVCCIDRHCACQCKLHVEDLVKDTPTALN
jgi:hypothetical protein